MGAGGLTFDGEEVDRWLRGTAVGSGGGASLGGVLGWADVPERVRVLDPSCFLLGRLTWMVWLSPSGRSCLGGRRGDSRAVAYSWQEKSESLPT